MSDVLTIEELLKYKDSNREILEELKLLSIYKLPKQNSTKFKNKPVNFSDNWLINQKFNQNDDDKLYAQFRSILNKLSDSNFNELAKELVKLEIKTQDHLKKLVDLIFKKAIVEKQFNYIYGQLAKELVSYYITCDNTRIYFRELLINRCQQMFTNMLSGTNIGSKEEALGCIRLIGELYKNGLLLDKIMHVCIINLINKCESKLEINGSNYITECISVLILSIYDSFKTRCPGELNNIYKSLENLMESDKISKKEKFVIMDLLEKRY